MGTAGGKSHPAEGESMPWTQRTPWGAGTGRGAGSTAPAGAPPAQEPRDG